MKERGDRTARADGGAVRSATEDAPSDSREGPLLEFTAGPSLSARLTSIRSRVKVSAVGSATAALVAVLLLGGQLLGAPTAVLAAVAGVVLAASSSALSSDSPRVLLAAGALLTPAAVLVAAALAVAVGFALRTGPAGQLAVVVVLLIVLASFAATLTALPAAASSVFAGAFSRYVATLIPLTVVQVLVVAAALWEPLVVALADLVFDSPEPLLAVGRTLLAPRGPVALLTFLVYVLFSVLLLRSVLRAVPISTLFPPRQRPEFARRIDAATRTLTRLLVAAGAVAGTLYAAALLTGTAGLGDLVRVLDPPLSGLVFELLTAVWLRILFVLVIGSLGAILVAERFRRRVRRRSEDDLVRGAMPPLGVVAATAVAALVLSTLFSPAALVRTAPEGLAGPLQALLTPGVFVATVLVTFGALIAVGALFVSLSLFFGTSLLPSRAMGPALASGAVFGLALSVVLFRGGPAVAVLGGVLALVAWDAGEFATGLREELGPDAATTRGELVHVGGSLAVGLAAFLGVVLLELLIASDLVAPSVPDTALAAGALTLAFAAVVVLVSALRE